MDGSRRTGPAGRSTTRRAGAVVTPVVAAVLAVVLVLGGVTAWAGGVVVALAGAGEPGSGSPAKGTAYTWPLTPPPVVVTPFRAPTHRFGPGHRGVDLAAAAGTPVRAAAAGVVVFAGPLVGRGVVSLQHPDGLRTTYEPVTPRVASGTAVVRGALLGLLQPGHPGCPAVCLHWGARRDRTTYVDPLLLLAPPAVRLLPVPDPWPDGPAAAVQPGSRDGPPRGWPGPVRPGGEPGRGPPSAVPR